MPYIQTIKQLLLLPIVFIACNWVSEAQTGTEAFKERNVFNEYKVHAGLSLDPYFGIDVAKLGRNELRLPFAPSLNWYFYRGHSVRVAAVLDTRYTTIHPRLRYPKTYPTVIFVYLGYEHAFFAPRRINLLTGLGVGYQYHNFEYYLEHTYAGFGSNIGCRVNMNQRWSAESNVNWLYGFPLRPNSTSQNVEGHLDVVRFLSLDLNYHFDW